MRDSKLTSPTVTEMAALAQLIAQRDPALMPAFLHCLGSSTRARRTCEANEPSAKELDGLRKLAHGAELIGSYRKGAAWLERRQEALAAALDRALPMPRPPRPSTEGEDDAD